MTGFMGDNILPAIPTNPDAVGTAEPRVMADRLTPTGYIEMSIYPD